MSQYRELKINNSYTTKEKEFYQTFPYQKALTKYDYTFNKYQREDLDWLAENACSPEYQHQSDTFQTIKEFIEENLPIMERIGCIPRKREFHLSGYGQTIIKIILLDQTELFQTRGVVLQQMRDYLNDLPYFIPYEKGWDNRSYVYKFHIEEYIIDQIRNNPNLNISINMKNIKIYRIEQGRRLLDHKVPIRQEIYQKIKSYLKYQPSKTHFCGIITEKRFTYQRIIIEKNLIYQPYDSKLTFTWEERYDQCQQIQTHPLENLLFGEKLKLN
jgi:hypothetical protein